ncbi:glutamate racemase [Alicyclobacillus sp. SO9]|uniref:glutamate racemase n=1 Tax=Alicyclobacillus sp. SO9 TaxID=2665646 RepID=UPI001E45ED73|nr:glutamate racemase [Alicyclobacillus sp. SO9]
MQHDLPIGIFDSGVGGLTVASAIAKTLPNEQIFYFGDMARCPYGNRNGKEVTEFSVQIVEYLLQLGVKMIVVACNTATATALPELRRRFDIPIIGVIQPGSRAAAKETESGRVGVIGTTVTIASGAYELAVHAADPNISVYSLGCPAFVPLVEQGKCSGQEVESIVHNSLEPLRALEIDTLILGCTHYPLLEQPIAKVLGPSVRLISSADETALEVHRLLLEQAGLCEHRLGPNRYFTTGNGDRMAEVLHSWMNATEEEIQECIQTVDVDVLLTAPR